MYVCIYIYMYIYICILPCLINSPSFSGLLHSSTRWANSNDIANELVWSLAAVAGGALLLLLLVLIMAVVELLLSPAVVGEVSAEGDGLRALAGDIVTLEKEDQFSRRYDVDVDVDRVVVVGIYLYTWREDLLKRWKDWGHLNWREPSFSIYIDRCMLIFITYQQGTTTKMNGKADRWIDVQIDGQLFLPASFSSCYLPYTLASGFPIIIITRTYIYYKYISSTLHCYDDIILYYII